MARPNNQSGSGDSMRARIKQDPIYPNVWDVQIKSHWWSSWKVVTIFNGEDAKERALACAKAFLLLSVIEVML